ncbi:hypothetical protein K6625_24400 [Escherichia coli]|nr:hypothetical protein [Escherichia coli]MBZ2311593.1 hypothetical protein [Escherichia coli]MBZ2357291.1 hypothetical protein [Escherichia coli]MBZ2371236.1 hypothetical protein [Escherichia coli]MBZ2385553.1 hypothetical protein [Escherichia coli]
MSWSHYQDAITQIEVMQEQAVKAFVSWMTNQEGTKFLSTLQEITTELDALIDAVESHSPVFRKKATELEALLAHYKTLL